MRDNPLILLDNKVFIYFESKHFVMCLLLKSGHFTMGCEIQMQRVIVHLTKSNLSHATKVITFLRSTILNTTLVVTADILHVPVNKITLSFQMK